MSSSKSVKTNEKIVFSKPYTAQLETATETFVLQENQVLIQSKFSLISNGSEMGIFKNLEGQIKYPIYPGYTVIGTIEEIGSQVAPEYLHKMVLTDIRHQLYGVADSSKLIFIDNEEHLPEQLFSRIGAVSFPSIMDTSIKPTERVLVTGLGIVGFMAAQILKKFGYEVFAVDRDQTNREIFSNITGIQSYPSVNAISEAVDFGLLIECTGSETVVFDAFTKMRKRSEVYLVGVPWTNYSNTLAAEFTREIFYKYITVHSGWEWFYPEDASEFSPNSRKNNIRLMLKWIINSEIKVDGMYKIFSPSECSTVYSKIASGEKDFISAIFDWTRK